MRSYEELRVGKLYKSDMDDLEARAMPVNFSGKDLTEATQLTVEDNGKILFLNAAAEFTTTLPALEDVSAGWNVEIVVKAAPSGAAYVVTEKASADTDKIITNGIVELEVDTGTDGLNNTGHTTVTFADGVAIAGDWIKVRSDGTNWYVTGQTKADGGITLA